MTCIEIREKRVKNESSTTTCVKFSRVSLIFICNSLLFIEKKKTISKKVEPPICCDFYGYNKREFVENYEC